MATNATFDFHDPNSQPFTLHPMPPLISGISDLHLSLLIPAIVHWVVSGCFEILDRSGWLMKYRIHTSTEDLLKNRVSRLDCFIAVVRCQILQTILGIYLAWDSQGDFTGFEEHEIAVWTLRVHAVFETLRDTVFSTGFDLGKIWFTMFTGQTSLSPATTHAVEFQVARVIYWYIKPTIQIVIALIVADMWMYCLHRTVHVNKFLYKHVHSIHHRLYVPYSWGSAYGHIFDNVVVDGLAYASGTWAGSLSTRLSMILFAYASFKNVTDHCGYDFTTNPVRLITGPTVANALFHDVHHQSWGLKKNFGAHFTIWDHLMGTYFDDEELAERNRTRGRVEADALLIRRKFESEGWKEHAKSE